MHDVFCMFMRVLGSDDLTYAFKNTQVAWIYRIFWKQGAMSVICYLHWRIFVCNFVQKSQLILMPFFQC